MITLRLALPVVLVVTLAASATPAKPSAQSAASALAFDPTSATTVHVTVDGVPLDVRRYHVVYVARGHSDYTVELQNNGLIPMSRAYRSHLQGWLRQPL